MVHFDPPEPREGRWCGACGWELALRRQQSHQGIKTYLVCQNPNCQWVALFHIEPPFKEKAGDSHQKLSPEPSPP